MDLYIYIWNIYFLSNFQRKKKEKRSVRTRTIKHKTQRREEVAQMSEWPSLNTLPFAEYRAELLSLLWARIWELASRKHPIY